MKLSALIARLIEWWMAMFNPQPGPLPMTKPRYVWYFEDGDTRQPARITADHGTVVSVILADATHRASVQYYDTPIPVVGRESAHRPDPTDLPDGDALDRAIEAARGVQPGTGDGSGE